MHATELLRRVEYHGAHLGIDGGRVYVEPVSAIPPELYQDLKSHKRELLTALAAEEWPPESLDCERRFGVPYARLFPLIGTRVQTALGEGKLLQVLNGTAAVVLDAEQVTFLWWTQVHPLHWCCKAPAE